MSRILLVLLTLGAAPARADSEAIDQVHLDRAACFANRAASATADMAQADACRRLTHRQRLLVGRMSQLFCDEPIRFCNRFHCLNEAATREFTSPRCERPVSPVDADLATSLKDDARFHEGMVRAWGCEPPRRRVERSRSGPKFVLEYDCDRDVMPFSCRRSGGGTVRGDTTSGEDDTLSRARAQVALYMTGADFERTRGNRCRIRIDDGGLFGIPSPSETSLPQPPAAGEDFDAYRAGLAGDLQGVADGRMADAAKASQGAFGAAGELLGVGSEQFRLASRTILDEDRVAMVERSFAAAKQGLESYLKSIGAPQTVIDRALGTELLDLRAFLRRPPRPARGGRSSDGEIMSRFELNCRDPGDTAFGTHNAFNSPHHSHAHGREITICPRYLLSADLGNPRALIRTMLHELGHSIDPCRLSDYQMNWEGNLGVCRQPVRGMRPTDAAEAGRVDAFIGRVGEYATCSESSGRLHPGDGRVRMAGMEQALTAGTPPCFANPCGMRAFISPAPDPLPAGASASQYGGARFCDASNWPSLRDYLEEQGERCADALAYYETNLGPAVTQGEQANEHFSDHLAAMSLTRALDSPHLADDCLSGLGLDEQRAELTTALASVCEGWGGPQPDACSHEADMSAPLGEGAGCAHGDTHADAYTRLTTLAGASSIRAVMGCEGAPRADRFPYAGCASSLCEGGTCPADSVFPYDATGMPETTGGSCR